MGLGGIRKATSGIMGPWPVKAHSWFSFPQQFDSIQKISERGYIDPARWCVAVGSPPPGCAVAAKGTGAHLRTLYVRAQTG